MPSERENFEHTFRSEYCDEEDIESVQDVSYSFLDLIPVHGHHDHVQANEQHDCHIELSVRRQIEDYCLGFELQRNTNH